MMEQLTAAHLAAGCSCDQCTPECSTRLFFPCCGACMNNKPCTPTECNGGEETGVDWANGLTLHTEDKAWHPWDTETFGEH